MRQYLPCPKSLAITRQLAFAMRPVRDRLTGGSQPGAGPPMSFCEVVCTERQESSALQEQLIWGGAGRARIQRARLIGGAVWLIRW
jgi:hypothetical protein